MLTYSSTHKKSFIQRESWHESIDTHTRRTFLKRTASLTALVAAPTIIPSSAIGLDGATAANERIGLAGIGMGGQGRGDLGALLDFPQIQAVAVCDVVDGHCQMAKDMVDCKYANNDCTMHSDFREVLARRDVNAVLIGTPDHWHVPIAIEALKHGKDVYSEEPETLTINEGKRLREVVCRWWSWLIIDRSANQTKRNFIACWKR